MQRYRLVGHVEPPSTKHHTAHTNLIQCMYSQLLLYPGCITLAPPILKLILPRTFIYRIYNLYIYLHVLWLHIMYMYIYRYLYIEIYILTQLNSHIHICIRVIYNFGYIHQCNRTPFKNKFHIPQLIPNAHPPPSPP